MQKHARQSNWIINIMNVFTFKKEKKIIGLIWAVFPSFKWSSYTKWRESFLFILQVFVFGLFTCFVSLKRPSAAEGHTTFIATDRGHLLPGVRKKVCLMVYLSYMEFKSPSLYIFATQIFLFVNDFIISAVVHGQRSKAHGIYLAKFALLP